MFGGTNMEGRFTLVLLSIAIFLMAFSSTAQEAIKPPDETMGAVEKTETTTTTTEPINVLFTFENNKLEKLIEIGVDNLKDHWSHAKKYNVTRRNVYLKNPDATRLVADLCYAIDDLHPDIIVDFTERGVPSEAVKILSKTLHIPTVSMSYGSQREWFNMSNSQYKYLFHVKSPADVVIQVTRTIARELNLSDMVIFYNDDYEMFYHYRELLKDVPTRHRILKIGSSKEEIKKQMEVLQKGFFSTFVIAGKVSQVQDILSVAKTLDDQAKEDKKEMLMTDRESLNMRLFLDKTQSSWYILSLDEKDKLTIPQELGLVHMEPAWTPPSEPLFKSNGLDGTLQQRFIVDLLVNAIDTVGTMKAENKWPEKQNISCVNYKYDESIPHPDLELGTNLTEISKLTSFSYIKDSNGRGNNLIGMKLNLNYIEFPSGPSSTHLGEWQATEDLNHTFTPGTNLTFHKPHTVYRVVTVVQHPFVYKTRECKPKHQYDHCYTGYAIDMINGLQKSMEKTNPFNYTIFDVDKYGVMHENGTHDWDGMVRVLQDKEADIAIGAFSVLPEREKVMEFTHPIYPMVGFQVLMRKRPLITSLFKFLTVLENDVWMCILGAYFFTSVLMWIFDRWSPYSFQNNKEKFEDDEEKREFSLKESLWFCITSLTPQGGGEAPKNLSGRLVAATWWLFGFIIIASYTANLAAFLTVSRLEAPIESLEDLSRQYKVQYAAILYSSAYFYFDRMAHIEHKFYEQWKDLSLNDSLEEFERSGLAVWEYPVSDKYTKFWQSMMDNRPPDNYSHAVLRCKGADDPRNNRTGRHYEEFAWIGESPEIQYEAMTHCMFRVVGKEFSMRQYAIGVQKGSPLKGILNEHIRNLTHERFFEKLKVIWWDENKKKVRCKKYDNLADGISIHNIGGVFLVLVIGFTMTFISTVLELWWYHRKNDTHEMPEFAGSEAPSREWSAAFPPVERTDFQSHYSRPPSKTNDDW